MSVWCENILNAPHFYNNITHVRYNCLLFQGRDGKKWPLNKRHSGKQGLLGILHQRDLHEIFPFKVDVKTGRKKPLFIL